MFRSQTGSLVRKLFIVLTLTLSLWAAIHNLGESRVDASSFCCSLCDQAHEGCADNCFSQLYSCNGEHCEEAFNQCLLNCDHQFVLCESNCDGSC
jgi:hypothetical protein